MHLRLGERAFAAKAAPRMAAADSAHAAAVAAVRVRGAAHRVMTMQPGEVFWERFGHDAIVVDDPARARRCPTTSASSIRPNPASSPTSSPGACATRWSRCRCGRTSPPIATRAAACACNGWISRRRRRNPSPMRLPRTRSPRIRATATTTSATTAPPACAMPSTAASAARCTNGWPRPSRGLTYRSESTRLASPARWMWLGFELGLGPNADVPLSRWDDAFVPMRLADNLRDMRLADGRPLVAAEEQLLPHRIAPELADPSTAWWPYAGGTRAGGAGPRCRQSAVRACSRHARFRSGCRAGWSARCCSTSGWARNTGRPGPTTTCCCSIRCACCCCPAHGRSRAAAGPGACSAGRWRRSRSQALAALAMSWLQVRTQQNMRWIVLLLPIHLAPVRGPAPALNACRARPLRARLRAWTNTIATNRCPPAWSTAWCTTATAAAATSAWTRSATCWRTTTAASSGSACTNPEDALLDKLQEEFHLHDLGRGRAERAPAPEAGKLRKLAVPGAAHGSSPTATCISAKPTSSSASTS